LVRYQADGNLEYLGRLDYQVKLRGFRIESGEIEAVLNGHPQVEKAVVLLTDKENEPRLVAYLVLNKNQEFTPTTSMWRDFLLPQLPQYMIPSDFIILEKFPLTPNYKVDRRSLPKPNQLRPKLNIAYALPQTEIEKTIATIWQEILQVEKIGIHDNFFDLGGHSLLIMRLHSQIKQKFACDLPLVEMFKYPTISALADYLSSKDKDKFLEKEVEARSEKLKVGKQRFPQRRRIKNS
jgi:acyl carrier protein